MPFESRGDDYAPQDEVMDVASPPGAQNAARVADFGGVLGATFAALCCAGTPFILAGLSAMGLGFLKRDAVLWPLMIASLLLALWGFWAGLKVHRRPGPLLLAFVSSIGLTAGVIFVHGFPAMQIIWSSIAGLAGATVWNLTARKAVLA